MIRGSETALAPFLYLAITLVAANIVGAATVVLIYMRAWRASPREHRALPLHVWLVALGHTCLSVGALIGLWRTAAVNPTNVIRIVLFTVGSILTLIALWVIARRGRQVTQEAQAGMSAVPAVVIVEARQPHEILIAFWCFLAGVALVVSGAEVGTLEALLPTPWLILYAATLILSGVAVIVGIVWRDHLVELAGLVGLAGTFTVYMVASFTIPNAPHNAAFAVGTFVLATLARIWQIRNHLTGDPAKRGA